MKAEKFKSYYGLHSEHRFFNCDHLFATQLIFNICLSRDGFFFFFSPSFLPTPLPEWESLISGEKRQLYPKRDTKCKRKVCLFSTCFALALASGPKGCVQREQRERGRCLRKRLNTMELLGQPARRSGSKSSSGQLQSLGAGSVAVPSGPVWFSCLMVT